MGCMQDVPRSERFADLYFSADDGPGETAHVFLDGNNLAARWQGVERFAIGETGFGTGLNFLLAWELWDRMAPKGAMLDFVSVEKYPMRAEEIRKGLLPWAERLSPYLEKMFARYPMRVPGFHRIVFDGRVALTLIFDDANDALGEIEGSIDAWFLDGFTPAKNPDMWTDNVFGEMARLSHAETTFATFTAAGFVKRGLQSAGFHVEKQKGFGRKRDMLAGSFMSTRKKTGVTKPNSIAILGAGLAGSALAHVLPQYGLDVEIHDPNGIASAASGNPVGILNPRISAHRTAESDYHTAAFALAARELPQLADVEYERIGSLHLVTDSDKEKRFAQTVANWGWTEDHMRLLMAEEASGIAGVNVRQSALYLPEGARVNPAKLCRAYTNNKVLNAQKPDADITIYACGAALADDPDFSWLPVQSVRGQITFVRETTQSACVKTNICYGGYFSPSKDGLHVVGSTFQKWIKDTAPLAEDDISNIEKLREVIPLLGDFTIEGNRAALRASSQDRFPVIGPWPDDKRKFLSAAHGSHGIIGSLMAAHILADYLRGGPYCVGKSTLKALAPTRFEGRHARKNGEKA